MAAGRTSKSVGRRRERGGEDEEEDDDGQLWAGDSQSESSGIIDLDERPGGDDANVLQVSQDLNEGKSHDYIDNAVLSNGAKANGKSHHADSAAQEQPVSGASPSQVFKSGADTEAMMHGLKITDDSMDAIDFQTPRADTKTKAKAGNTTGVQSRQKREHEEYKKKRDSNPAFIPNRGNFFMHDTRGQQNGGPAPYRGDAAARGRGRSAYGEQSASGHGRNDRATAQVWKHDLHSSINEEPSAAGAVALYERGSRPETQAELVASQNGALSFSSAQMLGRIQIRVLLPAMSKPITYSEVPAVKYVRLPDHRPPLRRDKPVRIFLPGVGPRYIFPSTDRSFVFIPRQMRPNSRGYHNAQRRSIGGYGYSSRRTSMYGGSMYSASIAPSRRSSITRDRENMFSPASYVSGYQQQHRPVVRLPHNAQFYPSSTSPMHIYSGQHTPTGQIHTYPLPQQPALQGIPTTTVQHPRPQKAISVSGIESPAMHMQQPAVEHQAFQGQLPVSVGQHSAHLSQGSIGYDFSQPQFAYAPSAGTNASPLTRIPENMAYANSFPPQQQMFYPAYSGGSQGGYYYPPVQMPMFAYPPMQQQPYPMTMPSTGQESQQIPNTAPLPPATTGMVAHESNGMVFYMPATDAGSQSNAPEHSQAAEGFAPSFGPAGIPPTPSSDQGVYYYPGMPTMANDMGYYPPIQQSS